MRKLLAVLTVLGALSLTATASSWSWGDDPDTYWGS